MAALTSEPPHVETPSPSRRSWKVVVTGVVVVAVLVVGAGVLGWAIRGAGKSRSAAAPTVSLSEAQIRYIGQTMVADPVCLGVNLGGRPSTPDPTALDCKTALVSMAAMLRSSTWPTAAKDEAVALAAAIDTHVALLKRMDAATPSEAARIAADAMKNGLTNSPWWATHQAAQAMRDALQLGSSGDVLL